jgi:hypothetical protein
MPQSVPFFDVRLLALILRLLACVPFPARLANPLASRCAGDRAPNYME